VTAPSSRLVGEGIADLITLASLTAVEVTEARMVFELGIVPLVCERATADDIAELRALVEAGQRALDADNYTMDMSASFHTRVAACTHNPAIEMLVQSFHGPLLMSLQEAHDVAPLMGHRGSVEHAEFVDAIERRNAETASTIMRQHLERTAERVGQSEAGTD
jgi:GntR family transcriptional repressor for pyruvate dehydrogenase complex